PSSWRTVAPKWGADQAPARRSEPFELLDRPLVADVPGVEGRGGLEEEDVGLYLGRRPVLDAARHDEHLSLVEDDVAVAQLHPQAPLDHQEQLVLVIVVVPDEGALELDQLDGLAVQLGHQLGGVVLLEQRKLLGDVDFLHGESISPWDSLGGVRNTLASPGLYFDEGR